MNSRELGVLLNETYEKLLSLSASKGVEYSGPNDRLDNFKRLGTRLDLDPRKVLYVYLTKHMDSIDTYIREGGRLVLSEPIEGRIDDAILYLVLLKGLIRESVKPVSPPDRSPVPESSGNPARSARLGDAGVP